MNERKSWKPKKQKKAPKLKELKFVTGIGINDYKIKVRSLLKFLEKRNQVRILIKLPRRDALGYDYFLNVEKNESLRYVYAIDEKIEQDIVGLGKVFSKQKEAKQITLIIHPLKT